MQSREIGEVLLWSFLSFQIIWGGIQFKFKDFVELEPDHLNFLLFWISDSLSSKNRKKVTKEERHPCHQSSYLTFCDKDVLFQWLCFCYSAGRSNQSFSWKTNRWTIEKLHCQFLHSILKPMQHCTQTDAKYAHYSCNKMVKLKWDDQLILVAKLMQLSKVTWPLDDFMSSSSNERPKLNTQADSIRAKLFTWMFSCNVC